MKKYKKWLAFVLVLSLLLTASTGFTPARTADVQPTLISVQELADGGKIYSYRIDGVQVDYPVPPAGFSPLTADDETLETYGFPPRPADRTSDDYADWAALMANYKSSSAPEFEVTRVPVTNDAVSAAQPIGGTAAVQAISAINSDAFAGYKSSITATNTKFYNQAQVDYVHPGVQSNNFIDGNGGFFIWTGIGDQSRSKLVQAGTGYDISGHYAWYRIISTSESSSQIRLNSFNVSAGNRIHVYISFQAANGKFNYYFANNTTGQSASAVVSAATASCFDGSMVSWGIERPRAYISSMKTTAATSLSQFATFSLTNCKATMSNSSTWLNMGSLSGLNKITMKDWGLSSTLCAPGSISSGTSFPLTWYKYY